MLDYLGSGRTYTLAVDGIPSTSIFRIEAVVAHAIVDIG